ncbi:hypothetical protein ACLKMY_24850 [Paraburkholderia mimosarum]|uniref:hypothetical protein n=1 Tax=Paraburkholderia mimosarum TaxID=312026 RepID=UPI0039C06235
MKKIVLLRAVAVALAVTGAMQSAIAHTQEWYADHVAEARVKQSRCLARLKADESLSQDEMAECQRASDAVFRSGKFTPSARKSY